MVTLEVAPRPPAVALVEPRGDQALRLEPAERDEDGRLRDRPSMRFSSATHERHAVGLPALAQHRQEHVELEVLKGMFSHGSVTNSVSRMARAFG